MGPLECAVPAGYQHVGGGLQLLGQLGAHGQGRLQVV